MNVESNFLWASIYNSYCKELHKYSVYLECVNKIRSSSELLLTFEIKKYLITH